MQTENNQDFIKIIANYLQLVRKYWKWILLSPAICCIATAFYLLTTPKVYERTAKIIVKEESKKGAGELDEMTILNEINFFFQGTNINNEREVLQSQKILQEVVERLNLEMSYKKRSGLKEVELYDETPVKVLLPDTEKMYREFSLCIKPLSKEKVKMTILEINSRTQRNEPVTVSFFDTVSTPFGRIVIVPTDFFDEYTINKSIYVKKLKVHYVTDALKNKLSISTDQNTSIITISLTDNSISRAEDILNTLIIAYNENRIAYKNQIVSNTSEFINARLEMLKEELDDMDKNISMYKSSNMIADMKTSAGLFLKESSDYNKEIFELQNKLSVAGFIKDYLANPANRNNLIPSNAGMKNEALEKEISEYNTLMLKKSRLLENSSEKSPAVVEVSNALIEMKRSITRSVDNLIKALNLQLSGMKNRAEETNQKIASVPTKEMNVASLERRAKIQEKLYLYLLQKREENELGGAMTVSNYKIVDNAEGSFSPISPKKYKLLFFALVIGFMFPLIILYFKELFDTSVKQLQDVTDNLSIPFLGAIPQIRSGYRILKIKKNETENKEWVVIKNGSQDAINEAFRIVRTNINAVTENKTDKKVLMLTSFDERAGKSFIALNLAVSFGLAKKKTLLIDLNLRNATLSSETASSQLGISDYLSDKTSSIEQITVKKSNIDFMPVGMLPSNPVELLEADDRLKNLIAELRKRYDYIIIDTTAFDTVADANIIGRISDMTLFIIRERMSNTHKFTELEDFYKNNK